VSPIRPAAWIRNLSGVLAGAGLLVRFAVQDRVPGLDLLYYALPLPVTIGLLLVAAVLSLRLGQKRSALACTLVSCCLLVLWMRTGAAWHRCAARPADFKVLEWNTAHGRSGWAGIVAAIRRHNADVIGLVEADAQPPATEGFWKGQFPEYSVSAPGSGLVLLVRGEIRRIEFQEFGTKSRLAVARIVVRGMSVRVVLVDLEANPMSRRKLLLEHVTAVAATPFAGPTLILGDFNTPGDSVWFGELRRTYSEVLEKAGSGLLATWPFPLPLLGLDHIWVSKGLVPVCAGKRSGWRSDHSQVWSELAFAARSARQPAIAGR